MTVIKLSLLFVLGTACGGSSNGTLRNQVNNAHLAPVSAAERASEAEAQQEVFLAEWQIVYTESQLRSSKLDIKLAKNKLASAKLEVKNAVLRRKAAQESADQNAVASATHDEKLANLQIAVHTLAIEHAKQSSRVFEKRLEHEKRRVRTREAGVELAKATSLQAAGIRPPKFDAKKYKTQHSERLSSAKAAKASVDSERTKLSAIEAKLVGARNAVATAKGEPPTKLAPPKTKPMEDLPDDPPETRDAPAPVVKPEPKEDPPKPEVKDSATKEPKPERDDTSTSESTPPPPPPPTPAEEKTPVDSEESSP